MVALCDWKRWRWRWRWLQTTDIAGVEGVLVSREEGEKREEEGSRKKWE